MGLLLLVLGLLWLLFLLSRSPGTSSAPAPDPPKDGDSTISAPSAEGGSATDKPATARVSFCLEGDGGERVLTPSVSISSGGLAPSIQLLLPSTGCAVQELRVGVNHYATILGVLAEPSGPVAVPVRDGGEVVFRVTGRECTVKGRIAGNDDEVQFPLQARALIGSRTLWRETRLVTTSFEFVAPCPAHFRFWTDSATIQLLPPSGLSIEHGVDALVLHAAPLGDVLLEVVDQQGQPVTGAELDVSGESRRIPKHGLLLPDLQLASVVGTIRAEGYRDQRWVPWSSVGPEPTGRVWSATVALQPLGRESSALALTAEDAARTGWAHCEDATGVLSCRTTRAGVECPCQRPFKAFAMLEGATVGLLVDGVHEGGEPEPLGPVVETCLTLVGLPDDGVLAVQPPGMSRYHMIAAITDQPVHGLPLCVSAVEGAPLEVIWRGDHDRTWRATAREGEQTLLWEHAQ